MMSRQENPKVDPHKFKGFHDKFIMVWVVFGQQVEKLILRIHQNNMTIDTCVENLTKKKIGTLLSLFLKFAFYTFIGENYNSPKY